MFPPIFHPTLCFLSHFRSAFDQVSAKSGSSEAAGAKLPVSAVCGKSGWQVPWGGCMLWLNENSCCGWKGDDFVQSMKWNLIEAALISPLSLSRDHLYHIVSRLKRDLIETPLLLSNRKKTLAFLSSSAYSRELRGKLQGVMIATPNKISWISPPLQLIFGGFLAYLETIVKL